MTRFNKSDEWRCIYIYIVIIAYNIYDRSLTLPERLILGEQLKKSNDILSQREAENVKRLEDRENELDKLFKGEEKQQLKKLTNDEVPQEAISHGKFEEMRGQNKITEAKGIEGNSRMMRYAV